MVSSTRLYYLMNKPPYRRAIVRSQNGGSFLRPCFFSFSMAIQSVGERADGNNRDINLSCDSMMAGIAPHSVLVQARGRSMVSDHAIDAHLPSLRRGLDRATSQNRNEHCLLQSQKWKALSYTVSGSGKYGCSARSNAQAVSTPERKAQGQTPSRNS